MAKTSSVVKNNRRRAMALRHRPKRKELREAAINPALTPDEREKARKRLQAMPRNGSMTRVVNRCQITGRPKGVYKRYLLSRLVFREMAHQGLIPGVRKASW